MMLKLTFSKLCWLQTTQPTNREAVTAVTHGCANCVEPSRQCGPDLPFLGGKQAMQRVRQPHTNKSVPPTCPVLTTRHPSPTPALPSPSHPHTLSAYTYATQTTVHASQSQQPPHPHRLVPTISAYTRWNCLATTDASKSRSTPILTVRCSFQRVFCFGSVRCG